MDALTWTTDRPAEEGHYWLRRTGRPPVICEVVDDSGRPVIITAFETAYLDTVTGEWAGPIPLPTP